MQLKKTAYLMADFSAAFGAGPRMFGQPRRLADLKSRMDFHLDCVRFALKADIDQAPFCIGHAIQPNRHLLIYLRHLFC